MKTETINQIEADKSKLKPPDVSGLQRVGDVILALYPELKIKIENKKK